MSGSESQTVTPPVCADELAKLYTAIMAKMTGRQRTKTRFEDQEAEYSAVPLKDLERMYMVWWNQCGSDTDYPDLTKTQTRGSPAHVRLS